MRLLHLYMKFMIQSRVQFLVTSNHMQIGDHVTSGMRIKFCLSLILPPNSWMPEKIIFSFKQSID